MARKYQPLGVYLAHQPPATTRVTLTLVEIEAIIGTALPPSARTPVFWVNTHWYGGPGSVWRWARWRKEGTYLRAIPLAVTFARLPGDSTGRVSAPPQ